jgi:hypothetical protein
MNIRRILREERRLSPFINRRLPEDEINTYFNKVKNRLMTMIISDNSSMMDKDEFKQFIITYTINFIMENYYDTFPEMTDFYEKLFDELYEYYNNEMDESYESINNMNLQEHIRRMKSMMGVINETKFFRRRVDLDRVEHLLKLHAEQVFGETKSYEEFKYELTLRAVEAILYQDYELGWEDLPSQEEIDYVNQVSELYEKTIKKLYKHYKK